MPVDNAIKISERITKERKRSETKMGEEQLVFIQLNGTDSTRDLHGEISHGITKSNIDKETNDIN